MPIFTYSSQIKIRRNATSRIVIKTSYSPFLKNGDLKEKEYLTLYKEGESVQGTQGRGDDVREPLIVSIYRTSRSATQGQNIQQWNIPKTL